MDKHLAKKGQNLVKIVEIHIRRSHTILYRSPTVQMMTKMTTIYTSKHNMALPSDESCRVQLFNGDM
jgi:hypothetical protein